MSGVSLKGKLEIAEHEGIVPAPYLDSVGVWTFGIGHTAFAGPPDPAKMPRGMPADVDAAVRRALEIFGTDIATVEARIAKHIKVPLAQHEYDAIASVDFNTGFIWYRDKASQRMRSATAIQRLNAGDRAGAADAFLNWVKPPELKKRRNAERRLFLTGNYEANGDSIAVWKVDAHGKLRGLLRTIHGAELLEAQAPDLAERVKAVEVAQADILARLARLEGARAPRVRLERA